MVPPWDTSCEDLRHNNCEPFLTSRSFGVPFLIASLAIANGVHKFLSVLPADMGVFPTTLYQS